VLGKPLVSLKILFLSDGMNWLPLVTTIYMGWVKITMHQRFVPPSYQCDLCKKLQCLDQGVMSVQDYYAELQKSMIRGGVHEETEDKIYRFYGVL
jgi:hypothetical protein